MNRHALHIVLALSMVSVARSSADATCVVTAPGECLQVTTAGAGADVVLIPSLFGSAFAYRQVVPLLTAAGYRSIVIEPLGVGHSARPATADYSLTAQADRIRAVLDSIGVREAILVSHSISTSMALRLACRNPGRVRAVVAIEGSAAEDLSTPAFKRAMKFAPLLKLLGPGRMIRGRVRVTLVSRSGNAAWVTDDVVDRYAEGPSKDFAATLDALAQMAKAREPEALAPRLRELRCPVRLLLGDAPHEGRPTEGDIQILERNLADFAVSRIPGVGNFIFEEAPEALVAAVNKVRGERR